MRIDDMIMFSIWGLTILVALGILIYAFVTKNKELLKNSVLGFIACLTPGGIILGTLALFFGGVALLIYTGEYILNKITAKW